MESISFFDLNTLQQENSYKALLDCLFASIEYYISMFMWSLSTIFAPAVSSGSFGCSSAWHICIWSRRTHWRRHVICIDDWIISKQVFIIYHVTVTVTVPMAIIGSTIYTGRTNIRTTSTIAHATTATSIATTRASTYISFESIIRNIAIAVAMDQHGK